MKSSFLRRLLFTFLLLLFCHTGASARDSSMEKIADLKWTFSPDQFATAMRTRPGVEQRENIETFPAFKDGILLEHPVVSWSSRFFGERLIRINVRLQAPGDLDQHFEMVQRKIDDLLGDKGTKKREGNQRLSIWKREGGGPANKGEVVVLRTMPQDKQVMISFLDNDLAKP